MYTVFRLSKIPQEEVVSSSQEDSQTSSEQQLSLQQKPPLDELSLKSLPNAQVQYQFDNNPFAADDNANFVNEGSLEPEMSLELPPIAEQLDDDTASSLCESIPCDDAPEYSLTTSNTCPEGFSNNNDNSTLIRTRRGRSLKEGEAKSEVKEKCKSQVIETSRLAAAADSELILEAVGTLDRNMSHWLCR